MKTIETQEIKITWFGAHYIRLSDLTVAGKLMNLRKMSVLFAVKTF